MALPAQEIKTWWICLLPLGVEPKTILLMDGRRPLSNIRLCCPVTQRTPATGNKRAAGVDTYRLKAIHWRSVSRLLRCSRFGQVKDYAPLRREEVLQMRLTSEATASENAASMV